VTVNIVTDSIVDLPPPVVEELAVIVVPLHVRFGTEIYRDNADLVAEQSYNKLIHSKILPVTSVPSPRNFAMCLSRSKTISGDRHTYRSWPPVGNSAR